MIAARALLLLSTLWIAACVSILGAETPEQQFYTAQGVYVIAAEEAVAYIGRPDADPVMVKAIQVAEGEAHKALVMGRVVLREPASDERDERLIFYARIAQVAIGKLQEALAEEAGP